MKRFLAAVAGGVLLIGCHGSDGGDGDDDSSGFAPGPNGNTGTPATVQFAEDFSTGFPADNWLIDSGTPVVVGDQGQFPPALSVGMNGETALVRTPFAFSTSGAFTLSFDFRIPAPKPPGARFEFRLAQEGTAANMASAIVPETGDVLVLNIGAASQPFPFAPDGLFHRLTLQVAEDRTGLWLLDGGAIMAQRDFPAGAFRIALFGHGNSMAEGMLVDNISLTRP